MAKFTYDDSGKRTSMTTADGTIYFHYHKDKVIYETDENNNIIAEYTWDQEGNPVSMTKNDQTYYYHLNGHGDVVALTDNNGNVVAEYEYDAWGNILSQTGSLASENPYRYAGYRYDEETGLYYLMARYYDANIGRFLTKDTFRGLEDEPQSLNQYAYTKNNPVMYVDPDGHHPGLLVAALVTALRVIGVYGFRVTWHVGLRMLQRHVNPKLVAQAIKYGRIYYDPWYGSLVYWYCSLAVAVSGKAITTVYWGPPKKRWKRIK